MADQSGTLADAIANRDRLAEFLASAPEDLREWAEEQLAQAEETVTSLQAGAAVEVATDTTADGAAADESVGADPVEQLLPTGEEPLSDVATEAETLLDDGDDKYVDIDALAADAPAAVRKPAGAQTPRAKAARARARERRAREAAAASAAPAAAADPSSHPRRTIGLAALAVVIPGLIFFVWQLGRPQQQKMPANHPEITQGAPASPTPRQLDEAKVRELEAKVAANPADVDAMRQLGDLYFKAERYDQAIDWERKVIAQLPQDVDARLVIGVAEFNQEHFDAAREAWEEVLGIDERNVDAHYNLGFLFMSLNPPQIDKTEYHWNKVIEIAPGSDVAKVVESHLDQLQQTAATPTPSATPSPR